MRTLRHVALIFFLFFTPDFHPLLLAHLQEHSTHSLIMCSNYSTYSRLSAITCFSQVCCRVKYRPRNRKMNESEKTNKYVGGDDNMSNDGVELELSQRDFMRLNNMYKKLLKENDINGESYVFDDFMRDVFALFLKRLKYADVEVLKERSC